MANNGDNKVKQALTGVTTVNDNDIICGRGGLALKHPGNMAYRKIVGLNKELYATCLKTEKLRISKSIVAAIREINGRFLEREDGKTSSSLDEKDENGNPVTWRDISDKRAIEKTSQALREGQPKLLKKLAQQQDNGMMQAAGVNPMAMNGHFNLAPQSQMMPQFGHMQSMSLQNGIQAFAQHQQQHQPQNAFQAQHRPGMMAQQRPSFTLAQLVEGQSFNSFPIQAGGMGANNGSYRGQDSWQDSWGSEDPKPLGVGVGVGRRTSFERSNSRTSQDSWGGEDPTPLPYHEGDPSQRLSESTPLPYHEGGVENVDEHVFSTDDHQQLMTCLGVEGGDASQNAHSPKPNNKRPSVKFHLQPQRPSISGMSASLSSHLSEMSIFSDVLSLDSAMDAAQREAEFDLIGEFESGEMSIGTFESVLDEPGTTAKAQPRRSILRKSNKWTTQNSLPPAPLNNHVDPGMIFTSTLDTTPGGVNSGTDISGLLGERRKSIVAFEVDVNRRRSSRMSMCSALTEFSGIFKRDVGSVLSIQSADFRELMADIDDDDDDDDSIKGDSP
ncbi:hypothetical protein ACHAXR_006785 [Thalassiosira sp. AJA248-18]